MDLHRHAEFLCARPAAFVEENRGCELYEHHDEGSISNSAKPWGYGPSIKRSLLELLKHTIALHREQSLCLQ